jgi:N-acetylneuraminic acid mutarotase
VPGGRTADGQISSALEAYDPQRDSWQALAPLPEARAGYALAAVEGKLYLFGGVDGAQTPRAEVWQYNPDLDTWQPQTAMSEPRAGLGSVVIDDQVFLIGGENASGPLSLHQRYSPAEEGNGNPYTIRAPLPVPYSRMGLAETGGLIFLFGNAEQGSVLIYDSAADSWRTNATPLGADLRDLRVEASAENKLYLFGGRVGDTTSARAYAYQALYQILVPDLGN